MAFNGLMSKSVKLLRYPPFGGGLAFHATAIPILMWNLIEIPNLSGLFIITRELRDMEVELEPYPLFLVRKLGVLFSWI